jgi:Competence protein J (ComJ)
MPTRQFTLEISYSQVAVFNPSLDAPFNNWTEAHFNQGFVWRPESVSFRTAARTGQGTFSLDRLSQPHLRDDAIVAISVPFLLKERRLEIASVFKGEVFDFDPGEYELVFQTGKTGTTPWVDLQFVAHKVTTANILKGHEHLKPAKELLMTAEPA